MLEVRGLAKRFGEVVAVADVSFEVGRGEAVGLLGPNGAGKSTTVSLVCGLLRPDSGEVRLEGRAFRGESDPHRRKLGLVPQELALVEELSGRANLRFFGALFGLGGGELERAVGRVLELVGLTERAGHAVRTYSGGMKRRLNLASALMHEPSLLILDEPTVGVDPQSRNAIFEGLTHLREQGVALLYTTHYMEEAECLCDRIVIIDHGRVVADGDLRHLASLVKARELLTVELDDPTPGPWLNELRRCAEVRHAELDGSRLVLELSDRRAAGRVVWRLDQAGRGVTHLESARADLATIFLALTGRSLRDG